MINKLTLIGRTGKEPRLGSTSKGSNYASVSIASGSNDSTVWFDVLAYDKQAEWLAKAPKGTLVYIEGPVSLSKFQTKDGKTLTNLQVTAYQVRLLSKIEQDSLPPAFDIVATPFPDDDSDIPF